VSEAKLKDLIRELHGLPPEEKKPGPIENLLRKYVAAKVAHQIMHESMGAKRARQPSTA
jgi:hypothetical protein